MGGPAREPEDFTKGGKCSRCGGCCSSVLPLSDADVKRLRKFAEKKKITPALPGGNDVVYLHCPFLADGPEPGTKKCLCYEVRPMVCRTFSCANTNAGNARAWLDRMPGQALPEPRNAWSVFGRTGLRIGGQEVPYAGAPWCRIRYENGVLAEFRVGRPVSLELADGRTVPPSIVFNLSREGLQLFNAGERRMETIAFQDIAEILTEGALVKDTETEGEA